MSGRTGSHGLPANYRTPDDQREDWQAALGYLRALEDSCRAIVMAAIDPRQEQLDVGYGSRLTQQIGFLKKLPGRPDRSMTHHFALNWPEPDQPCGEFTVDERLFEGASLDTVDGDDYFGLTLDLGPVAVVIMDANINMENAYVEWQQRQHQTYLGLPTPSEIEEKWRIEPNRERVQSMRQDMRELRVALVEKGAGAAKGMSEAELAAAGERVGWHLRTSGRMSKVPHTEWYDLWLDELAESLRKGG